MNIHFYTLATIIIGFIATTHSTAGHAVPFGNSAYGSASVQSCSTATLVSIPITVDVTSTIYATVTGIANNSSPVYPQKFTYQIILRDSADTTNLATSTGNSLSNIPNQQFLPFNDSQVLAGSSGSYVAAPGNYLLKVVVGGGIVCGVTPISANGELTYILLSSALDRIFANGFALKSNSEIMAIMA